MAAAARRGGLARLLVVLAVLAAGSAAGLGAPPGARPPAEGALPRLGVARNFALTTSLRERLWLAQLRGRAVVLGFFCTACASCPGQVPALAALARALGPAAGSRVVFALVTLDPRRDGPAALRAFAEARGLDPAAWVLWTGKPAEVAVVARWYGVVVEGAGLRHTCPLTLIDRRGVIRARVEDGAAEALRPALEGLLAEDHPRPPAEGGEAASRGVRAAAPTPGAPARGGGARGPAVPGAGQRSSRSRAGSSIRALTCRRKVTASRPSTMRWS